MPLNTPIIDWTQKRVWIIGASTGIGEALAKELAGRGARVCLSARTRAKLELLAKDLPGSVAIPLDITDADSVTKAASDLFAQWKGVDMVIIMAGTYVEMRAQNFDLAQAKYQMDVNLTGVLNILAPVLPQLVSQKSGHLSIVSSVAGYRGLPNSLVYGSSKAALINMAESLYIDLVSEGVSVSVVDPGFVETPLTAKNEFPMPFIITADEAARQMIKGYAKGEFEINFPKAFTRILRFLRVMPYGVYFKAVKKITKM